MTLPTINTDMLLTLVKWAETSEEGVLAYPELGSWYQQDWGIFDFGKYFWDDLGDSSELPLKWSEEQLACGTAHCIAGAAAQLAGWTPVTSLDSWDDGVQGSYSVVHKDGVETDVDRVAQQLLGLTYVEAQALFDGDNNLRMIKALISRYHQNRDLPAPYPEFTVTEEFPTDRYAHLSANRVI
jgi:hypothetical protein